MPLSAADREWRNACIYAGLGNMVCWTCGETASASECETCKKAGKPSERLQYRGLIERRSERTLAAGDGAQNHKGLGSGRDRSGQWSIRRLV